MRNDGLITNDHILGIQAELEHNSAGFGKVRMAIIHHRLASIHPFYDGNGRTVRILTVLCLSRQIVRTTREYCRLLQAVREADAWEEWVASMLTAVAERARDGVATPTLRLAAVPWRVPSAVHGARAGAAPPSRRARGAPPANTHAAPSSR